MKKVTRLYESLQPENYEIYLKVNPDKFTFSGKISIKAKKTGPPSQRITLHQSGLKITSASVTRHDKKGDEHFELDRINTHDKYEELRLHATSKMFPGQYTISIEYEGKITDPMNGIYPCRFTHDGEEKMLIATQFESHHAREVLPCIDEPEAKATFDMTLDTPKLGEVLANTPASSSMIQGDRRITEFETTPVMSTYLLAFAHGEVGFKESKTKRGTIIRSYATPDNVEFTEFSTDVARQCLEFYEDYFDIAYPLQKCDMIALPDFASGAMENWGLITYREQTLLVDPKNTSTTVKQYVAMVVAHELAHQWFGNLVTMRWWTDLWLNEGFASWIEYLAVDKIFPEWNMWTQFISSEQQPALKLDSLDNTHAIEVEINHPDEIRSIFDGISYGKGASVIHMLYGYLGEKDFRNGLRHYLKKHAYSNAETQDLWSSLEHVSKKPVKDFMHAWTSLPGYPVVRVDKVNGDIELHQERYYLHKPKNLAKSLWPVPLLDDKIKSETLKERNHKYKVSAFNKLNQAQSGFYRTAYSQELVSDLMDIFDQLKPEDRLGLIADSFETSKAFYSSTVDAMKLLVKFKMEETTPIWDVIASNIGEIRRVMDNDEIRSKIKPFIRELAQTQYERLGWEESASESYFDGLLRPTILGLLSGADHQEVIKECRDRFDNAKQISNIPTNLRSVILVTVARHGDSNTFDKLLKFHNSTNNSEDKVTLAAAITSFEQPELINRALDLVTTKTIRRQDAMYWIAYSFMNRHAKDTTWKWMKDNWTWMEKEMGSDLSFYRTPIYAARSFSSSIFLKEYDKFFAPKITPALKRSIDQGHEMLEWQIAWRKRDSNSIKAFLS